MKTKSLTKEMLQRLMKMDDFEYGELVMDTAKKYLYNVLLYDKAGKNMLWRSQYFWVWWSRQWERRNRILIEEFALHELYNTPVDEDLANWVRQEYMTIHSIERLNILPNRLVLASSFACMLKAGVFTKETITANA